MDKIFMKNRKNQRIAVLVDKNENQKGLAFVVHGLGGFKEQAHIEIFAESFKENGYTVVRFDTTNTFGESDGDYSDATMTRSYQDLEDVIEWSRNQIWYQEPFALAGHSLGGAVIILYAEEYSEKVRALAPISSAIPDLYVSNMDKEVLRKWKVEGVMDKGERNSKPGCFMILKWNFVEDIKRHKLLERAIGITMPIL
ncbi:alpha/beta hydrolase, partial [Patescibacteria group bacterium]